MGLKQCSTNAAHQYPDHLNTCPFCAQATRASTRRASTSPSVSSSGVSITWSPQSSPRTAQGSLPVSVPAAPSPSVPSVPPASSSTPQPTHVSSRPHPANGRPVWQSVLLTPVGAALGAGAGALVGVAVFLLGMFVAVLQPAWHGGDTNWVIEHAAAVQITGAVLGGIVGIIVVWATRRD